jgi:hypothetical protein
VSAAGGADDVTDNDHCRDIGFWTWAGSTFGGFVGATAFLALPDRPGALPHTWWALAMCIVACSSFFGWFGYWRARVYHHPDEEAPDA